MNRRNGMPDLFFVYYYCMSYLIAAFLKMVHAKARRISFDFASMYRAYAHCTYLEKYSVQGHG
mgnify:CR=1 FL=1